MAKLTDAEIAEIAAGYGLDPTDSIVTENAAHANARDGQKAVNFDGNLNRFWGCDEWGFYDAARLLDGYLSEDLAVAKADCMAIEDFHERAYGSD